MQYRSKLLFISLFVVASFLCVNLSLAAAPNVTSNLLLNLGIQYDNNFFYDAYDEIGVTTFLVQPGIELGLETGKSEIEFRYTLDANYYDESTVEDFYGHTALLTGDFEMSDRLSLNLSDNFIKTRDSAELDPLGNTATRYLYNKNTLIAILSHDFTNLTTRFGYQNLIYDYDDYRNEDSMGNQGIFDFIYYLNNSTSLDLEYQYWKMDYDGPTSDYTSNQVSLVTRKEWRVTSLEAGVGYHKREFDETGISDANIVPFRVILLGKSSSGRTRLSISAARNFNLRSDDFYGYYEANRLSLRLDRDLTSKVTLGLDGYYQKSDYVYEVREDDNSNIMAYINYQFRERWALYFSAGFESRNSNIPDEEYDNGVAMGQLRFSHNIAK
jgi:hypothetical protein